MTSKNAQKYDRQLRLWQAHGQAALESCNLLMIGSNNLACEVLKNLILPGIGSYTIMDDKIVQGEDVGSNFFLLQSQIGESRAKATCQMLQELNVQVRGNYIEKCVRQVLSSDPSYFHQFSMVVYCGEIESDMLDIGAVCYSKHVPFVFTCIYGFLGYCRLVVAEHTVVESHPESIIDLHLDRPWEELANIVTNYDFSNLTSHIASHIPFPALILEASNRWKAQNTTLPSTRPQKTDFQNILKSLVGESQDDENLREALSHCFKLFSGTQIPSDIRAYMSDGSCVEITKKSSEFWIMMQALKRFVENEGAGALPVSGVIPDMKADTDSYVLVQRIYREKAVVDCSEFKKHLANVLNEIGREPIDTEVVERFCKYAGSLKVIRGNCLAEEYSRPISESLRNILADPDTDSVFYLLLRAANRFRSLHGRFPGTVADSLESDSLAFEALFSAFTKEYGIEISVGPQVKEIVRAGACELPNMAALIGGIASQEIIKLITHQYVPVDNAVLYNGVKSTTATFKI